MIKSEGNYPDNSIPSSVEAEMMKSRQNQHAAVESAHAMVAFDLSASTQEVIVQKKITFHVFEFNTPNLQHMLIAVQVMRPWKLDQITKSSARRVG